MNTQYSHMILYLIGQRFAVHPKLLVETIAIIHHYCVNVDTIKHCMQDECLACCYVLVLLMLWVLENYLMNVFMRPISHSMCGSHML